MKSMDSGITWVMVCGIWRRTLRILTGDTLPAANLPVYALIGRVRLHPDTITEDRTAGKRAGGIDGEDPDARPTAPPFRRQPIDQRALADPG